jgi:hypothetical protein
VKRIIIVPTLLASILVAATSALAQPLPPSPAQAPATLAPDDSSKPIDAANWFAGSFSLQLLGRDDVASSKFQEYRIIPKGPSMPVFQFQGAHAGNGFAIFGRNISQRDQRYSGWGNTAWVGVRFDYNEIPHNMGNNARTIHTEITPDVWAMSATLRQALGAAVDAVPTASRTYPFYLALLTPTIDAANHYDLNAQRKRTQIDVDLGRKLPFGLEASYTRDLKTGYRGASAGDILGVVTASVDVLEPLNEETQDFGVRWSYNAPKKSTVYASLNRNLYDDRFDSLIVDNPFRATDLAFVSTSVPGGPAQARFSTSPDNEATRFAFGGQLKFERQTRVTADLAFGQWTQNAPFLPYTINSAVFTTSGLPANATSSLQQPSLDGKIDTASYNFTFTSRPADRVAVRARYRNYSYKDKSARFVIAGDLSGSPDRSWGAADTPTADEPYGHATANRTDQSVGHFEAQVGYDIAEKFTVEGVYRNVQTSYVGRRNTSGTDNSENGYTLALVHRTKEWLDVRFHFDDNRRTVSGIEAGSVAAVQGVMADHAERNQKRIGADVELMPSDKYGVTFGYNYRKDDYPNRPFKVAGDATTESGLLEATYDMYSVDFTALPNPKVELTAFYSYEKVAETNQWITLTSGALNNRLTYAPWDKGNTFGVNGVFHIVPDTWTLTVFAQQQDVNGFLDITAREAGSFYTPGRTTLIPAGQGGAADIDEYDDMRQTTLVLDLGYTLARKWTLSGGYAYDRFKTADAFSDGTTMFPQAVLFYLKANDGNYSANIGYVRLNYRF